MEIKELGRDVLGWRPVLGGGDDPLPIPAAAFSAPSAGPITSCC